MTSEDSRSPLKKATAFDVSQCLDSEENIAAYLQSVIDDEDWDILLPTIGNVAKARAVNGIATRLGLDRDSLYAGVRPESVSIGAILRPLIHEGSKVLAELTLPRIAHIEPRDDHTITITLADGQSGRFDMKEYLDLEVFRPLRDLEYFHQVRNHGRYLCWPDDQDLCADSIAASLRYDSEVGEGFADDDEMEEIRSNTELAASMARGLEDARAGRGWYLEDSAEGGNAPSTTPKFDLFQECLYEMMRRLSQEVYFAGWLQDLEYRLWSELEGGSHREWGFDLDEDRIHKLRELSRLCGGWISYPRDRGAEWVPIERWTALFQAWKDSPATR